MDKLIETSVSSRQEKNKDIIRYVIKATVIALIVIGAKTYFEHLPWGHRIEILAFEILQGQMLQFSSADRLQVFVVDISKMPGGKDQVTPRTDLRNLVEAIARLRPRAIAIDVDFSPDEKGWKDDNDPAFFDFCLNLKKETRIPVFLGVYRTRMASPDTWLGSGKYEGLAADMTLPAEVFKIRLKSRGSDQLPTLSAALAYAYTKPGGLPEPPKWLMFILEKPREKTLVNYSKLDQLKHETLPLTQPTCVAELGSRFFNNKMVIIGDATLATDHRYVPGRFETVPGVYVHACAAYTLAIEPLYELTFLSKIFADLAVAMLVILGVAYARFRHIETEGPFSWHDVEFKWINRIIFSVSIVGILLVRWAGIMWLDFLLVIYALRLHPSVEQWLKDWWNKRKK
jgi:CHASE2 domain-containing sensor protein